MFHCFASCRSFCRGTFAAGTLLATMVVLVGCQSPAATQGFRLPGTPNLPGIPQTPTPKLTPGGHTPAVPGVKTTAAIQPEQNEITQVGYFGRLSDRAEDQASVCQGCIQSTDAGSCQTCAPAYPVMGMGQPFDPQEFLCNGGDIPPEARVMVNDHVGGLDPQDAVVHYTTEAGDIAVQASNPVCLYSPRFGAIRQVSGAVAGEKAVGLRGTFQPVGPSGIGLTQPSLVVGESLELARADVARRVDAMRDRNRGVPVEGIVQPLLAEDALEILATLDAVSLNRLDESQIAILKQGAVAAQSWMIRDAVEVMIESITPPVLTRDAKVEGFVRYDFPDAGRLEIMKVADKAHAQQGDEVSFAIHVRNVGDSAVSHIEIADSLVGRLEYLEDSQHCDRQAEFTTKGNAAGSVRMQWTLADPLAVGETATIEFKCRVR
ncbi:DUF11 domain-containing protein [Stieleria sp. ICT_E10.1]|uniref:DUF11 domain-containing protein n=1 Tax=Stieleria sedimenti TaxID=2976331 RepID=UPI00218003A7|nr:DUF11 domain-containing protein [Stieleria sedimenti]MCS7466524.1 DUF11 domain-containing protein [Stieleria sedimenti]